jgi:hypothetical protein
MCPVSPKAILVEGLRQQGQTIETIEKSSALPAEPTSTVEEFPF